jgi:hypothetical protein
MSFVEQWVGFAIPIAIIVLAGAKDFEIVCLFAILVAGGLTYDFGWLQPSISSGAWLITLSCLAALSIILYMRKREDRIS